MFVIGRGCRSRQVDASFSGAAEMLPERLEGIDQTMRAVSISL